MMKLIKLFAVALALTTCNCLEAEELCPSIQSKIEGCVSAFVSDVPALIALFNNTSSVLNLASTVTTQLSLICDNMRSVEQFYGCFYTAYLGCMPQEWVKTQPSIDDATASVTYFCEILPVIERPLSIPEVVDIQKVFSLAANKGDISSYNFLPLGRSAGTPGFWRNGTEANSELDISCLVEKILDAAVCIALSHTGSPDVSTPDGYLSNTCRSISAMESCYKTTMASCPGRTAEVMSDFVLYSKPVGCNGNAKRLSWAIAFISLCLWLKRFI